MDFEEKTIDSKKIYKGNITEYEVQTVKLPNGQEASREIVWHGDASAVFALDGDRLLCVKQYRKPIEQVSVELPCGLIEEGEDPDKAANRELEEETGYRAQNLDYVTGFYNSPGFTNEKLYLYKADGIEKVENPLAQDDDETIEVLKLTYDEAWDYLEKGLISDSKTVFALYYWKLLKAGEDHV